MDCYCSDSSATENIASLLYPIASNIKMTTKCIINLCIFLTLLIKVYLLPFLCSPSEKTFRHEKTILARVMRTYPELQNTKN